VKKDESTIVDAVALELRTKSDRRDGDRRKGAVPVAVDRRKTERREKVNRRRQIDPTTCERDYSIDEVEFMNALSDYKRKSGRMFPTCSEILEVIRGLGYSKPGQTGAPSAEPFVGVETANHESHAVAAQ
jgi:hypothetical protein